MSDYVEMFGLWEIDRFRCLHCGVVHQVFEIKQVNGSDTCPTPGCDGAPLDWVVVDEAGQANEI